MKRFSSYIALWLSILIISSEGDGQIRSGAGFLKIQPGARESAGPSINAAGLNYINGFFANPAVTGFSREWQWSASYSSWIADLYTTSLLGSHRIPFPGTNLLRGAIGIHYLGIPDFNSTDGAASSVNGGDTRLTCGLSYPISIGTHSVALGINATYFHSQLAEFNAHTSAVDLGVLFRTRRMQPTATSIQWMHNVIIACGASVTNIGPDLTFISEGTPLPRTLRLATALYMGVHHGFQWNIASEFQRTLTEENRWGLSSELSWNQLFSMQIGYVFGKDLLGHFSFGTSIAISDLQFHGLLGHGQAWQLDLSSNESNALFDSPYAGSISAYPNQPEPFELIFPGYNSELHSNKLKLQWQPSRDPDLLDDLEYHLYISSDSTEIFRICENVNQHEKSNESITCIKYVSYRPDYFVSLSRAGQYFWTVVAIDRDGHQVCATQDDRSYGKFLVTMSMPRVIAMNFEYSPWITNDSLQGAIAFMVANNGNRTSENLIVTITDSLLKPSEITQTHATATVCFSSTIQSLHPDSARQFTFDWQTDVPGKHALNLRVVPAIEEIGADSAFDHLDCYTIPKGKFVAHDTVIALRLNAVIYELPYVGKIYFDKQSAQIGPNYIDNWVMDPPLKTFARRLQLNPHIQITLQGTADPNSNENDVSIADERAIAVASVLKLLGVPEKQISYKPGELLRKRHTPNNPLDAQWIFEERRRVDITTDEKYEEALFAPLVNSYYERLPAPIQFNSELKYATPINFARIIWQSKAASDTIDIKPWLIPPNSSPKSEWEIDHSPEYIEKNWLNRNCNYMLMVIDSLNRQFRTPAKYAYAINEILQLERSYYVIAKFAQTRPFYNFYWHNLLEHLPVMLEDPNKRIKFIGHGCAIGSDEINKWLSEQRADIFLKIFLSDVEKKYPQLYDQIRSRTDDAVGRGEEEPIRFKTSDQHEVLLGDNNSPIGRQLNRRVMVLFYTDRSTKSYAAE
jgi:outer membrane protein OmpA-like peptidoglycan-associated protein